MRSSKMLLFFLYLERPLRKTNFEFWASLSYLKLSQIISQHLSNKFWTFFL